jgi:dienelactone hydrolase
MRELFYISCVLAIAITTTAFSKEIDGTVINTSNIKLFISKSQRPTVIVSHGCDGMRNTSYEKWARYIDSIGYNAVMYDSYAPMKLSKVPCELKGEWWDAHSSDRPREAENISYWIKEQPWHKGKIAIIGFSAGGATALYYANSRTLLGKNISAAIAFYPHCLDRQIGPKSNVSEGIWTMNIPTQVHLGTADDWTPAYLCKIDNAEIITYPEATHAFDNDEGIGSATRRYLGHVMRYDKNSHNLSKLKIKEFLDKNLSD